MNKAIFFSLLAIGLALGLGFRLAGLDVRPMHHDEANQAVKLGILLETGEYRYDRNDHHGPALYYLTLPFAWARAQKTLFSLDEWTLRLVPALFGGSLALLFCLLVKELDRTAIVIAAILAALSPALTYYSRFYIQESLLAFFALGFLIALGKYSIRSGMLSALWSGAFAGLAFATKETSALLLMAAAAACFFARLIEKGAKKGRIPQCSGAMIGGEPQRKPSPSKSVHAFRSAHILVAAGVAMAIAFVFYSSFFRNPSGILDAFRAFGAYFKRGIDPGIHGQPWYFYLQILAFGKSAGFVWTEGLVLVLALAGIVFAFRIHRAGKEKAAQNESSFWLCYVGCYSLLTLAAFSLIRYKTPWNLIQFHIGLILLAGIGAARMIILSKTPVRRGLLILVLLGAGWHLGLQNWRANFRYSADPENPYAYAQTSTDFLRLVRRIHDIAAIHSDGRDMAIKVIAPPAEQWPLPWYVRKMRRVGYWSSAANMGRLENAPVIIASRGNAETLEAAFGGRYVLEFYGLRPGVLLALFIERPIWEQFLKSRRPRLGPAQK